MVETFDFAQIRSAGGAWPRRVILMHIQHVDSQAAGPVTHCLLMIINKAEVEETHLIGC